MNYKARREKLYKALKDEGILLLCAGFEVHRSADECYPFSVNRNFYYLTGIDQKDSYLLVDLKTKEETLFLLETDPKKARWIGEYLDFEYAKRFAKVNNVRSIRELNDVLNEVLLSNSNIYLDLEKCVELGGLHYDEYFSNLVKSINKDAILHDVYHEIIKLRAIKDEDEIDNIRSSIDLTKRALVEVADYLPTMLGEMEAQALFEYLIYEHFQAKPAFDTIVGAGKNSTILHYHENRCRMEDNDVVLLDLGACRDYYSSDISRTYPHLGMFTPLQRKIYQIVLDANKNVIALARPGITLKYLQEKTVEFLTERCLEAKLIKTKEEIYDVYFHSVSHHLGLDVHDPMSRDMVLEPGNVITDEPGLYFEKYGIGIRIEDDLLITEDGCENLSKDIVKEIDEVEYLVNFGERKVHIDEEGNITEIEDEDEEED